SGQVCHYMQEQGYKVRNMVGGMLDWSGETK
ncbi:rhodanese-like domain-containing protein, partial [Pseudomonas sp. MPR-R5A]